MLQILSETFDITFKVKLWVWGSHQFTVTLHPPQTPKLTFLSFLQWSLFLTSYIFFTHGTMSLDVVERRKHPCKIAQTSLNIKIGETAQAGWFIIHSYLSLFVVYTQQMYLSNVKNKKWNFFPEILFKTSLRQFDPDEQYFFIYNLNDVATMTPCSQKKYSLQVPQYTREQCLYFLFIYRSQSSSLCKVFDTISSNIDEVLSINLSAKQFVFRDFNVHHKDWLTYSGGTDRAGELCYNFSI